MVKDANSFAEYTHVDASGAMLHNGSYIDGPS